MGCEAHPVEPEIRFLGGRVEQFDKIPLTRWQRLTDPYALVLALIFALVFGVAVGFLLK